MVRKCLNVGFSRGSRKRGFKTDRNPYHTVGDVSRVRFLFLFSSLGFKSCAVYDSKAFDF